MTLDRPFRNPLRPRVTSVLSYYLTSYGYLPILQNRLPALCSPAQLPLSPLSNLKICPFRLFPIIMGKHIGAAHWIAGTYTEIPASLGPSVLESCLVFSATGHRCWGCFLVHWTHPFWNLVKIYHSPIRLSRGFV